jgi:hypothetical protein
MAPLPTPGRSTGDGSWWVPGSGAFQANLRRSWHTEAMGWMGRLRKSGRSGMRRPGRSGAATTVRASDAADAAHLHDFATSRRGVEGFVEPRTAVSDVTLILVAHDGEWTRRRVPSVEWAHRFANQNGIPSYDAAVVGYPERMREYNRRRKGLL